MTDYKNRRPSGAPVAGQPAIARAAGGNGPTPSIPHDLDAERRALGDLMLTAEAGHYAFDGGLDAGSFYDPGHQAAYLAIRGALDARLERRDPEAVASHAQVKGWLDGVGTNVDGQRLDGKQALKAMYAQGSTVGYRADLDAVLHHAYNRKVQARAHDLAMLAGSGGDIGAALGLLHDLEQPGSTAERFRGALLEGAALYDMPPREYLIDGVLALNSLAALYGPPGSYKSFVALDMALCVTRGQWWNGAEVKEAARVLYVAAEGVGGFPDRVRAWHEADSMWAGEPSQLFTMLPQAVNLMDPADADALGRVCRELGARFIVVDTLNRCMPGGDENLSRDMGAAVAGLDRIRILTGACVMAVHHTGKDTTRGLRGHSSLLAALDTALEVKASDHIVTLTTARQKDGESGGTLGRWTAKPSGPSMALERGAVAAVSTESLEALCAALRDLDTGGGLSATVLADGLNKGISTVYRWLTTAIDAGLVEKDGQRYRLTP